MSILFQIKKIMSLLSPMWGLQWLGLGRVGYGYCFICHPLCYSSNTCLQNTRELYRTYKYPWIPLHI